MKLVTIFFLTAGLAFILSGAPVQARAVFGPGDSGGGNDVALEFRAVAEKAFLDLASAQPALTTLEHLAAMTERLSRAQVVGVESSLQVPVQMLLQNSVVINSPSTNLIEVDADRWHSISDARVKAAIAVHEIESLLGEENTGVYKLSAAFLVRLGFTGDLDAEVNAARASLSKSYDPRTYAVSFWCQDKSDVLDEFTGEILPAAATDHTERGFRLAWADGPSSFGLSFDDSGSITKTLSVERLGSSASELVRSMDRTLYLGKKASQSGKLSFSYQMLGDGKVLAKATSEQGVFESQVSDFFTPQGTHIITVTRGATPADGESHLRRLSSSQVCQEKKLVVDTALAKLNRPWGSALANFIKKHQEAAAARLALEACVNDGGEACETLRQKYLTAAAEREKIWLALRE